MSVYFITAREVGKVKIGCAYDPFVRLEKLQTSSPVDLTLEAILRGAYREEKEFHRRFAEHRVRGEWFALCPEIEALIATNSPPKRPISVADKRRLRNMHTRGEEWKERHSEEAEKLLAQADIHFPFRVKEPA